MARATCRAHRRLPYLADLGVDAIWIAPWYPSPLADGGYDVTDYCDIHPLFGTLADADALLATAHELGIRVIVDLVANHTSNEHPWFPRRRRLAAGSRSVIVLLPRRRGADGELPPNNWISAFGGSAWTRVTGPDGRPGSGTSTPSPPSSPTSTGTTRRSATEFDEILRFWLDRGVDGFRVDAAPAMAKEPGLPDAVLRRPHGSPPRTGSDNPHWDVDGVHDMLRRWRRVVDAYPGERVFVAEAVVNGPERLARYLRPDELHTAFNFDYLHADWEPGSCGRSSTRPCRPSDRSGRLRRGPCRATTRSGT